MKQLLELLQSISHLYVWSIQKDGAIIGTAKGKKVKEHSPLTAIANVQRRNKHQALFRSWHNMSAAKRLGYNEKESTTINNAISGVVNRGYSQILRGKIKKAVGLK
jgi:hypothetical protein